MSETKIITDDELWDEFWHAGACGGSIARDCRHGFTFFHDDETADFDEGELEKLRAKAEEDPAKCVGLDSDSHFTDLLGFEWCWECQQCRAEALRYQTLLWDNRHTIANFLNQRLLSEKARAIKEHRNLSIEEK